MTDNSLNIDNVLNIIFKTTTKSPQIFADFYLRKDISIISRWRNGTILPKIEDSKKIVEFVINESTEVQRVVIKDELVNILKTSLIRKDIKTLILKKETFEDFLIEFLSALTIDCDLSEQIKYIQPSEKKHFTPKKHSVNTVINKKYLEQMNNQNNISGDYKGTVKFDLSIDKKGNISSDNHIKELIRNKNLNIKDLNKTKNIKYVLNKVTLVIVLFVLTSFLISQLLGNEQSNTDLEVAPAHSSEFLATPKQYSTANTDENKVSDMDKPTSSSSAVSSATNSTLSKNTTVVQQKQNDSQANTSPIASNKKTTERNNKSESNIDSNKNNDNSNNDIENSNNNININGSNNNLAIGSSTIILESE